MTAMEPRKPPLSRKNIAGQILFVVVILALARALWLRERPEPLEQSVWGNYQIFDENMYRFETHNSASPTSALTILQVQSIHQDKKWILVQEGAHYRVCNFDAPNSFSIIGGELYYAVEPRFRSVSPETGGARPASDLPAHTPGPMNAETAAQTSPVTKTVRVRKVSLRGGIPRDVATLRGEKFCLVGNHVFWIRPGQEEISKATFQAWNTSRELMLTSLADGGTRCIHTGLSPDTIMVGGEAGITWAEPAPLTGRRALLYARVADGSVRSLGALAETQPAPICLEHGDRLYWTELCSEREPNGNHSLVLMSAGLSGEGRHEVCARIGKHRLAEIAFHVYQNSPYCCFAAAPNADEGETRAGRFLCRLRSERADPIEILHKLPLLSRDCHFEEGYLYFGVEYDSSYRFPLNR